jgi:hypothetical protein
MAKAISIGIAADTSVYERAMKSGVVESTEDAIDALQDLARKGKDSGDDLEQAFKGAQKESERLGKENKETADKLGKDWRRGGQDIKDGVKKGTDGAKEGLDEFKDEANSTARESAASFDGSAESIIDTFQEVAANAFTGFGPAGAVAGLAVAAGIGIAVAAGTALAEAQAEAKQRTHDLALELYELGGDVDKLDIGAKVREWFGDDTASQMKAFWESSDTNFETALKYSKRFGLSIDDVVKSLSGFDSNATDEMLDLADAMQKSGDLTQGQSNLLREYVGDLKGTADQLGLTAEEAEVMERVTRAQSEATEAAIEAEQRRADTISTLQGGIDEAIGGYAEYSEAEGRAADPAAYIEGIAQKIAATQNFTSNVGLISEKFGLSVAESQALLDQGVSFGPMLQAIIDSGMDAKFIDQFKQGVGGGQAILDGADLNAEVNVDADVDPAAKKADAEAKKKRDGEIKVDADTKPATKKIQDTADRDYKARIDVSVRGLAGVAADIDRAARDRTSTITFNVKQGSGTVPKP